MKYDGPGRGRKQCPSCKSYVHVRTKVCDCGREFSRPSDDLIEEKCVQVSESPKPDLDPFLISYIRGIGTVKKVTPIYALAGSPAITLVSSEKNDVFQYCDDVINYGLKYNKLLMPSVIKGWIRNTAGLDQKPVIKFVEEWTKEIIDEGSKPAVNG